MQIGTNKECCGSRGAEVYVLSKTRRQQDGARRGRLNRAAPCPKMRALLLLRTFISQETTAVQNQDFKERL